MLPSLQWLMSHGNCARPHPDCFAPLPFVTPQIVTDMIRHDTAAMQVNDCVSKSFPCICCSARHPSARQLHIPQPPLKTDHTEDLIRFRRSDMGAALSHSLHHSRCPPLLTLERKHLLVNKRLLLLIAAFRPGCSAFRRPAQVQQCARLLSICGQQPQESSKCMLASLHASTYYQHPFCTGVLSCLLP